MRTILLSKLDEIYLQKCAIELELSKVAYGIIIGMQAEFDKYIAVHLAKNSEEDVDLEISSEKLASDATNSVHGIQKIEDIDTQALSGQWLSACKMIPGSFSVLGVFITAVEESILDERTFKVAKQLFTDINNLLVQGKTFDNNIDQAAENGYVFLVHSSSARKTLCKNYIHSSNGGTFTPMECRFVEKPFEWHTIECNYELDEIFPIVENKEKINVEQQFQKTIEAVRESLKTCEIFLQNETVDDSLTLEVYVKKKFGSNAGGGHQRSQQQNEHLRASIFLPIKCLNRRGECTFHVRQYNGTIRLSGIISSRIHCNPRNTLGDVKRFVRDDVLRSLAARIQVYCDGLTEPNISNETMFISEPPRRVYFSLPSGNTASPVQFSEYIFRGEAATVAVAQAKQVLDLDIDSTQIIDDVEDLPDDDTFNDTPIEKTQATASSNTSQSTRDTTRTMFILGIAVSILVLLISVALHFYLKS